MPELGTIEQKLNNTLNRNSTGLISELRTNHLIQSYSTPKLVDVLHNPLNPVGTCRIYSKTNQYN